MVRMEGILAAYLGCLFAMLITFPSVPIEWSMVFSLADTLEVAIPALAFRYIRADPALKTVRDMVLYLVFGIILNSLAGAFLGTITVFMAGINESVSMLVYFGTPYLRQKGLLKYNGGRTGCRIGIWD